MKSTLTSWLCVAIVALATGPRALAAPEEIESLFRSGSAPAADDLRPAAGSEQVDSARPSELAEPSPLIDHSTWDVGPPTPSAVHVVDREHGVTAGDQAHLPASPFTAVPEPSAVFLALAALVYFLLFGRRRRVI